MAEGDLIWGGTCADAYGDVIIVEVRRRGTVLITFREVDDGEDRVMELAAPQREQFMRLFMEAERQAEAYAAGKAS